MKLSTILAGLPVKPHVHAVAGDPDIWSLSEDSRRVKQGALFFARAGTKSDGRAFLADAIAAGAVAVVVPSGTTRPESAPASLAWIEADDAPLVAALAAERFFGNPSKSLALVGVTGTNGKTTIAYLTSNSSRQPAFGAA